MKKRAQGTMEMSFGMIFSIILMIFFVVVAFLVIRAFLSSADCAKVKIFVDDFQTEVDKTWHSQQDDSEFKGNLPSGMQYVCFSNLTNSFRGEFKPIGEELEIYDVYGSNMFFFPEGKSCEMPHHSVKHLNTANSIKTMNPLCIPVVKGKIIIKIKKGFNEKLVSVVG